MKIQLAKFPTATALGPTWVLSVAFAVLLAAAATTSFLRPSQKLESVHQVKLYKYQADKTNNPPEISEGPPTITIAGPGEFLMFSRKLSATDLAIEIPRISILQAENQKEYSIRVEDGVSLQSVIDLLDLLATASDQVQQESLRVHGINGPRISVRFDVTHIPPPPKFPTWVPYP